MALISAAPPYFLEFSFAPARKEADPAFDFSQRLPHSDAAPVSRRPAMATGNKFPLQPGSPLRRMHKYADPPAHSEPSRSPSTDTLQPPMQSPACENAIPSP